MINEKRVCPITNYYCSRDLLECDSYDWKNVVLRDDCECKVKMKEIIADLPVASKNENEQLKTLMNMIIDLGDTLYPNVDCWIDTGNKFQVCEKIINTIKEDSKHRWKRRFHIRAERY